MALGDAVEGELHAGRERDLLAGEQQNALNDGEALAAGH
jgi:hypothetical protein